MGQDKTYTIFFSSIFILDFTFSLYLFCCVKMVAPPASEAKHVTPFPYSQMIPLTFVLLSEMICMGMLFPIVGFLVAKLQNIPVEEAGYVSGILLGVFMLGQIVSAKTWGYISDMYGRRFPLISGLFTSGLAMLFFGLSTSIWLCAFFRFLQGLCNGNILVAKTMIADITDKTNQAQGFAVAGFTYGIGLIIGPAMGGILYDPVNNLSWLNLDPEGVFGPRPALLPSLVIFLYSIVGMTVCTIYIKESNLKAKALPDFVKYIYPCFWKDAEFFVPPPLPAEEEVPSEAMSEAHELDGERDLCGDATESSRVETTAVVVANDEPSKFGYKQAFEHPETRFMLIIYMLFAGGDTLINETFPLWAISSVEAGGFGFSSTQIGFLLLANGIPCVISTILFSSMCDKFNDKAGFFRMNALLYSFLVFILPLTSYLPHGWFAVVIIVVCQFGRQLVANWCFALCTMFTARSAPEKFIGAAMGISQSSCALTRACVPLIFAPLFAWSISAHHIFPFNHCLTFIISSLCVLLCWFRMYFVSSNETGRIRILEGGVSEAADRLIAGARRVLGSN